MHSIYLTVIFLCINNDGLGQDIDQAKPFPIYQNTSTSNQEISGSQQTANPHSQTTGISISDIYTQRSISENITDSMRVTRSSPQGSQVRMTAVPPSATATPTHFNSPTDIRNVSHSTSSPPFGISRTQSDFSQTGRKKSINPTISPQTISVSLMQNCSIKPTESGNAISGPAQEGDKDHANRTASPQDFDVAPHAGSRTINPSLPFSPPEKPPFNPDNIPPKLKTTPAAVSKKTYKPTTRAGLTKQIITKSIITQKYLPSQTPITHLVSTSTKDCSTYTGTFLELVFESNSHEQCRKQIVEIKEGIGKYANELNGLEFAADSVLVLNDCDVCKMVQNGTQVFKFCIQTGQSCNADATKNAWNKMDDKMELQALETYIPNVNIVSMKKITPTKEDEPKDVLPLCMGLIGIVFLILISAILIFRGKTKKTPMKDRFYFDGTKIQDCLETGNGDDSFCLHKVKDRELKHMSLLVPAINLGLDIDEEHKSENEFPSHLLSVNALKMYYTYKEAIDEEFKSLPYFRPSPKELPVGVGNKNRTAHVLPPLDTRVILSSRIDSNGYINANQIMGYQSSKVAYIATQAPLSNTCADFWHMIWEQQSRVIIMLCMPDEIGKNVQQYWPKNVGMEGALLFGDILVSLETTTSTEHHTVSNLVVKDIEKNLCRPVTHHWFRWPSGGVPSNPSDITGLLLHIRESIIEIQGPMVVHCSDGVGRTGTLLTIDICMHELEDTTHVDVPRTTCMVRKDRGAGVENAVQYNYIYQALYDYSERLSRANQQVGW